MEDLLSCEGAAGPREANMVDPQAIILALVVVSRPPPRGRDSNGLPQQLEAQLEPVCVPGEVEDSNGLPKVHLEDEVLFKPLLIPCVPLPDGGVPLTVCARITACGSARSLLFSVLIGGTEVRFCSFCIRKALGGRE